MKITEYSPSQYESLGPAWRSLETGKDMTAFQSFDWFRNINHLYHSEPRWRIDRKWTYLLIERDNLPILIAPIFIQRFGFSFGGHLWARRGAHMIGRHGYSDYLNFIYAQFDPAAVELLIDYLRQHYGVASLTVANLLAETELAIYLRATHRCRDSEMTCVALVLPETEALYDSTLSKSSRQNLRTAHNRCTRDGVELTHEMRFDIGHELVSEMRSLRMRRLVIKQAKENETLGFVGRLKSYIIAVLLWLRRCVHGTQDPLTENGRPWCLLARTKGQLAAFFWGIRSVDGTELYVILAAVHPEFEWYSPGKICLREFIGEVYQKKINLRLIDFTRGGESYKYELGGKSRPAYRALEVSI